MKVLFTHPLIGTSETLPILSWQVVVIQVKAEKNSFSDGNETRVFSNCPKPDLFENRSNGNPDFNPKLDFFLQNSLVFFPGLLGFQNYV